VRRADEEKWKALVLEWTFRFIWGACFVHCAEIHSTEPQGGKSLLRVIFFFDLLNGIFNYFTHISSRDSPIIALEVGGVHEGETPNFRKGTK
jgi:hypothetical protein